MTHTKPAIAALLEVAVLLVAAAFLTAAVSWAEAILTPDLVAAAEVAATQTASATAASDEKTTVPPLPELPVPDEIHRRAAEILAAPEYAPPRWQTWARRVQKFWTDLWTRNESQDTDFDTANSASVLRWRILIDVAVVTAGILVVLLLGCWVARRYEIPIFRFTRIRTMDSGPNALQSATRARGRRGSSKEDSPWPAADQLAAAGDYPEALRLIYKELLAAWEQRRLVADHQYRTDRQVGELIRQFAPRLYPDFMSLNRTYASCWYGGVPASPEIFVEFRRTAQRLMEGSISLQR